ncbi:DUF1203 domain-containing protein [Roseibium sp. HPY-6]|uniref:DUF1203 domain-containing protein n=1 Tax=Roseibium sp. HPY-6 TaxID=3229852 RepID=UPI00338D6DE4
MFQIHPLPAEQFSQFYGLSDEELARRNIQVHISNGASPCRVSLSDAAQGERVLLLNFEHQPAETPYRSRHAIFVADGAKEHRPDTDCVPPSIASRLLSVRAFDSNHEMIDAEVVDGEEVTDLISTFFANSKVAYLHLHFARRGCFAAKVTRADN